MKILLVEDDPSVAASVIDGLTDAGMSVTQVSTGIDALEFACSPWDTILLDLGLPDLDGQDVCRKIREKASTPIIILSARSAEVDRVVALEFGADDYIVKPFGMRELVARIKAVHRRTHIPEKLRESENIVLGALTIDAGAQRVYVDQHEIHLTAREFELLAYLAKSPGLVCRRADIMNDVWDTNWYGTTKTIDAHIAAIRKKLGHPEWLESVRSVGFRLVVTPE